MAACFDRSKRGLESDTSHHSGYYRVCITAGGNFHQSLTAVKKLNTRWQAGSELISQLLRGYRDAARLKSAHLLQQQFCIAACRQTVYCKGFRMHSHDV
ncbi:hypothetical protein D3C73_1396170 [compost metagenome]